MNFEEFRKSTLKVNKNRKHKITNSIGIKHLLKKCRDTRWYGEELRVDERTFCTITRTVNDLIAEELLKGNDFNLPQRMGQFEIRKYENYLRFEEGKIKTNRGIDWNATLKLWFEDEEAKENKTLVKVEDEETFILYYNRVKANYNNKTLIGFKPNRALLKKIKSAGSNKLIDAYKLGK